MVGADGDTVVPRTMGNKAEGEEEEGVELTFEVRERICKRFERAIARESEDWLGSVNGEILLATAKSEIQPATATSES